jgi:two-component system probable response regulator PhcQ
MSHADALDKKKSGTILFVDDEPLSLKYFQASVGRYANVRTANSPEAALQILESEGDDISVVVSDERMPRESGVAFLSCVRKSWPSTVRVLTSAYANIDNLQHAINDAAIYRFVPKPWNLEELCVTMQDALRIEHSAAAVSEPVLGVSASGDAHEASLALLAILAKGFEAPLESLQAGSVAIMQSTGQGAVDAPPTASPYLDAWASRWRNSKIAAASGQMLTDVEHCRSLASAIGRLARSLVRPDAGQTSSMSDTVLEVLEQNIGGPAKGLALDTSRDFTYRMPREIMKFVLGNVLRGGKAISQHTTALPAEISLFSGAAHNEVRLFFPAREEQRNSLDDNQTWRTTASALWAFGGELLAFPDQELGKKLIVIRLPITA